MNKNHDKLLSLLKADEGLQDLQTRSSELRKEVNDARERSNAAITLGYWDIAVEHRQRMITMFGYALQAELDILYREVDLLKSIR